MYIYSKSKANLILLALTRLEQPILCAIYIVKENIAIHINYIPDQ